MHGNAATEDARRASGYVMLAANDGLRTDGSTRLRCLSYRGAFSGGRHVYEWQECNVGEHRQTFQFLPSDPSAQLMTIKSVYEWPTLTTASPGALRNMYSNSCITFPNNPADSTLLGTDCSEGSLPADGMFSPGGGSVYRERQVGRGGRDCLIVGRDKGPVLALRPSQCNPMDSRVFAMDFPKEYVEKLQSAKPKP
jgi:hypothetical protein